jgi:hypothetical protein
MKTTKQTVFSFLHRENISYAELRQIFRSVERSDRLAFVFWRERA